MTKRKIELRKTVSAPVLTQALVQRCDTAARRVIRIPVSWQTVSVVAVGDAAMRRLNQQHRQANYIPDVLSFSYGADGGEIVICYPQAKRQANQKQVNLRGELSWLVVHGLLHLAGYDHETARDAKIMRPLEQKILSHV